MRQKINSNDGNSLDEGKRQGRRSDSFTKTKAENKEKADYQEDHNKWKRKSWKTQSVTQRNKNGFSQK